MVNQTSICFKCDSHQLEKFDEMCVELGIKRNKMLNFLVVYANSMLSDSSKLNLIAAYSKALIDSIE